MTSDDYQTLNICTNCYSDGERLLLHICFVFISHFLYVIYIYDFFGSCFHLFTFCASLYLVVFLFFYFFGRLIMRDQWYGRYLYGIACSYIDTWSSFMNEHLRSYVLSVFLVQLCDRERARPVQQVRKIWRKSSQVFDIEQPNAGCWRERVFRAWKFE
jgi:hypothetical protein